jgi:8-oxo-dGTP pyrophosphatase MutT (NUDIX family)
MNQRSQKESVRRIARSDLRVGDGRWAYAEAHAASIESGWIAAKRTTPNYFNGIIHLIDAYGAEGDTISARLLRTDFKSYLFWRLSGWPDAGVLDGFGSALLRSADGDVILGRQRDGHVNGGLTYLPGGFIDARDVRGDATIDLDASVRRELLEETGIGPDAVTADAGYYLTETGPHMSIAVPLRSHLSTCDLIRRIADHIRREADPELAGAVAVRRLSDLDRLPMAHYARVLLTSLLAGT